MRGIIFCVALCVVSLNAMPSGLDNQLHTLEELRRKGGAAKIGEDIAGGVSEAIGTSAGALAGMGLKVLEAIGGGIKGIGDKTASGLITGLISVGNLRRMQRRLEVTENVLDSLKQLNELRRKEIDDLLNQQMGGGVVTLEGLRRKGGAAKIGENIGGGISQTLGTSVGALAGLGLKAIEAFGGGVKGFGEKMASGLVTGLHEIGGLRRSLTSEPNGLGHKCVDKPWDVSCDWQYHESLNSPQLKDSVMVDLANMNLSDSGLGILGIGDIDTGDIGIAGIGKVNDITIS